MLVGTWLCKLLQCLLSLELTCVHLLPGTVPLRGSAPSVLSRSPHPSAVSSSFWVCLKSFPLTLIGATAPAQVLKLSIWIIVIPLDNCPASRLPFCQFILCVPP